MKHKIKPVPNTTGEASEEVEFDHNVLLDTIKKGSKLKCESSGLAEVKLASSLIEVAEQNGYTHIATKGPTQSTFYAQFDEPLRTTDYEQFYELPGMTCVEVDITNRSSASKSYIYAFCENDSVEAARKSWNKSDSVLLGQIEDDFQNRDDENEIESQSEFDSYRDGHWQESSGFVIFENVAYTKANLKGDNDWRLYRRNSRTSSWTPV